jgi:ribosomal protein RSM22 (predicted rRNA methylase)
LTTVKSAVLRPRTSRSSLRILTRRLLATQAKDAQHESEVADVQSTQLRTPTIEVNDPSIKLRTGTVQLPPELQKRIYAVLHDYPRAWLKRDSANLSELLRARTTEPVLKKKHARTLFVRDVEGQQKIYRNNLDDERQNSAVNVTVEPAQYNENEANAYIAHRLPGIFGCNYRVLSELKARYPNYRPVSVLDFGSGPGTALWAIRELWPQSSDRIVAIEPSDGMTAINQKLLYDLPIERRKYLHLARPFQYSLVIASYSLSELVSDAARKDAVKTLWEQVEPGGILVIVEPGTPIGFKIVRTARMMLTELQDPNDALSPALLAPCPHAMSCPMPNNSWCHFVQRIERMNLMKSAKSDISRNWENEKFSYIAISKGKIRDTLEDTRDNKGLQWSRLIRQPMKRGGHIIVDTCTPKGMLARDIVPKSDKTFKFARKSFWGDLFYLDRINSTEKVKTNTQPRSTGHKKTKRNKRAT